MKLDPAKTIYLIDGSSFLYRSYYAMRPLHTPSGEPVQAVYNFCRMIKKLLQRFDPHYIALVWDSKGKTQRHAIYSEYKATRQEAPSDLFSQKERILTFAKLIGLANIAQPGIEADDIMMGLARRFADQGFTVVLVTSDKDMGQVLSEHILLYDPFKDRTYNAQQFEQERAIPIAKLPLYFALLGDVSDNIPGVRGIGKKTALEIVQRFESLEHLYAHLDRLTTARVRTALEKGRENAFLSRKLFLPQPVTVEQTAKDVWFERSNWNNARPLFAELGFRSLLEETAAPGKTKETMEQLCSYMSAYELVSVTDQAALKKVVALLEGAPAFGLDTETDGTDAMHCKLVGISVSCEQRRGFYIPVGHVAAGTIQQSLFGPAGPKQLTLEEVQLLLGPVLANERIKKYLHNAKWDLHVLRRAGFSVMGVTFDTVIAARLVAKPWQRIGLKPLAQQYLNDTMLTYKQVTQVGKYTTFAQVPLDLATVYAAADALETFRLKLLLQDQLQAESMQRLFDEIEMPLLFVLYAMEATGIRLDVSQLYAISKSVTEQLERTKEQILGFAGEQGKQLNINSTRQVGYLLFDLLGLPPQKKGKTGYSTDQSVLEALSTLHPVPNLLLRYRELSKLKTTYLDALPTYVNPETGKIHTSFSQTIVATGRLSSSDPNLQNIPADGTRYGKAVRDAFIPDPGHLFISADYSQIELRVLAQLSGDQKLITAFREGLDVHAQTTAALFDVPVDQVSHEQRQIGKRINFSVLYGKTPYGLSKELGISFGDAKRYIETYFEQYPAVTIWMETVIAFAKEHGYVQTLWGRRRYIPAIYETNQVLFNEAKRMAINTVAQGTAADLIKRAMVVLYQRLQNEFPEARLLLQIHDELLLSSKAAHAAAVATCVQETLESIVDWSVPLRVTMRVGDSWGAVSK